MSRGQGDRPAGRVWWFYAAVIAWTWGIWIPLIAYTNPIGDQAALDSLPMVERISLLLILQLGAYGPSIVALIFSMWKLGGDGVAQLLRMLLNWRQPFWCYVFVFVVPGLLQLGGLGIFVMAGGDPGEFRPDRASRIVPTLLVLLLFGPIAEELGWRGYALPRLLRSYSAVASAMVMGIVATLWHMPLFFSAYPPMDGVDPFDITLVFYFAYTSGRCVLYTFVFQNGGHSVLLTVLFHAVGNAAIPLILFTGLGDEANSEIVLWSAIPIWLLNLALIYRYGATSLKV